MIISQKGLPNVAETVPYVLPVMNYCYAYVFGAHFSFYNIIRSCLPLPFSPESVFRFGLRGM